jgi:hypothetical protein
MAWAVHEFYERGNWGFSDATERRTFFHSLMLQFDQRWPVRDQLYPNQPSPTPLNDQQQQAVTRRQVALRRVSYV